MNRLAVEGRHERSSEDGLAADLLETSLSLGFLAAFIPWIALILMNAPILAPGGALAPVLRFQPYNAHYESMMAAIHIVWAVMLWRASDDPAKHPLFIDFTIWANVAHGLVMLVATPIAKGLVMTVIEGLPLFLFGGSAVGAKTAALGAAPCSAMSRCRTP